MVHDVLESYGALTLENLREHFRKNPWANPETSQLVKKLLGLAHLACLNMAEENLTCAVDYFCEARDIPELQNALRLAKLYRNLAALRKLYLFKPKIMLPETSGFSGQPTCRLPVQAPSRKDVDAKFRAFCAEQGIAILRKMQNGIEGIRRCSNVYLALDTDGIAKIYKEVLDYSGGRLGYAMSREDLLYRDLPRADFLPRYYGTVESGGTLFIKESVHYGQPLSDYTTGRGRFLEPDEARGVIFSMAKKIKWLHDQGIWHLDVKPENFYWNGDDVLMMDLGIARKVSSGTQSVDIYLADPGYATPEGAGELRAYETSDVFQLGIIFYELLAHEHPFALNIKTENREGEILKHAWPMMVADGHPHRVSPPDILLRGMLEKNPKSRATLDEVIKILESSDYYRVSKIKSQKRPEVLGVERQWILFPARMGIPHKGHINYISRLIELGFRVLISIQRSYTITDRDPFPKWLVMKMVAQSLLGRGFHRNDFDFVLTPYYRTEQELLMHFALLPKMEKVVAVASGNPGVHKLFAGQTILPQKAVFAFEGEAHEELSWGEIVRYAIKDNNKELFNEYAALGVAKILSFQELRMIYGRSTIEFVPGKVTTILKRNGETIAATRVPRYSDPETSLAARLKMDGRKVAVTDRFSALTAWTLDGEVVKIKYVSQDFDGTDLTINFVIS